MEGRRREAPERDLLRFLALNALAGAGLGQLCLGLLLATDAMGVGSLVLASDAPALPLALLAAMFAITFASAVIATAVLGLRNDRD